MSKNIDVFASFQMVPMINAAMRVREYNISISIACFCLPKIDRMLLNGDCINMAIAQGPIIIAKIPASFHSEPKITEKRYGAVSERKRPGYIPVTSKL